MSANNFYANSWQAQSPGLYKGLNRRMTNLNRLGQGLESLASTNQIYGQGADSMTAYISEVHLSLIQTLLTTVQTFQTSVGVYWQGYQQVDTHGDFRLVSDDLRAHVRDTGNAINHMTGFEQHIRRVANSVSHIVGLGSAGSGAIARVRSDLESMQRLARDQHARWSSYENHDPGFDQVEEMMASVKRLLTQIGQLSVGRAYRQGSFFDLAGITDLEGLLNKVGDYNAKNMPVAQAGWQSIFDEYVKEVTAKEKRLAKKKAQEAGLWGLLWDTLQVTTGCLIMVAGGVLAPFSGMMSLPLVAFGGSLVLGGVNSGINHAAMAIRGEGLNLVGMASDKIGGWYSVSLAKPAIASGNTLGQFFAGVGGAAGHMVSGIAQMNVVEITTGVSSLLSSRDARHQVASGLGEWWRQISSGNAYVAGETAFNLASLVIGAGEVQTAFKVARGGEATSLLSKSGIFVKTLGKSGAKNVQHLATMPGRVGHSLSDLIKNPRIAFAGVGDSNSLLSRIKGGDALPKKTGGVSSLDTQLGSLKNNVKINKYESAESVNNWWRKQGYNQPPYTPKTVVQEIKLLEDTKFVRVYDGVESGLYGGWVMRAEDIRGLTPLQIQEKFALPQLPKYIGEVTLNKGSVIRAGEVNPLFGSKGGGFQFDMMQQRIGEFKEIGKIIEWSGK